MTLRDEVRSRIAEFIRRTLPNFCKREDDMRDDLDLIADCGVDALDVIELVCDLEDEYGVTIDDAAVEKISTVGDLITAVENSPKAVRP